MSYFDGSITPVPKTKKNEYLELAKISAAVLKEFGAVRVVECWHDPSGPGADSYHGTEARQEASSYRSFTDVVAPQPDETFVWSWVEWPDKATRDSGMEKAMADPRMQFQDRPVVFDGTRVIAGGFEPILDTGHGA